MDGISLLLAGTVLGLTLLVSLFSGPYMAGENGEEKYYALLNAMMAAMLGLGCAARPVQPVGLVRGHGGRLVHAGAFYRDQPGALEAGVKYLVQIASGSMLVLLGIALVLAQTGTLALDHDQRRPEPAVAAPARWPGRCS